MPRALGASRVRVHSPAELIRAVQETNWPVHYEWYELAGGGFDGALGLVELRAFFLKAFCIGADLRVI
jgi:hypothetical protein